MNEGPVIKINDQILGDINALSKQKYTRADLSQVDKCFSAFSSGDPQCVPCAIQRACVIYRAEGRLGLKGIREKLGPGSPAPVPPAIVAEVEAAVSAPPAPPPPAGKPPSPPVAAAPPTAPPPPLPGVQTPPPAEAAPQAPPPTAPPPATPPTAPAPAAPPPGVVSATMPSDGAPPAGWPSLDRKVLVQMCHELGYATEQTTKRGLRTLILMVVKKKPAWKVEESQLPPKKTSPSKAKAPSPPKAPPPPAAAPQPPAATPPVPPKAAPKKEGDEAPSLSHFKELMRRQAQSGLVFHSFRVRGSPQDIADWMALFDSDTVEIDAQMMISTKVK